MKRIVTKLLLGTLVLLNGAMEVAAQKGDDLSPVRFLERVATHPVAENAEQDRAMAVNEALSTASSAEVEEVLPQVRQYARTGNPARVRGYAAMFLLGIALRPDGAAELSSHPEEIVSLISDADAGLQGAGVAIMYWVIGKPGVKAQPYVTAMKSAMSNPKTPQEVDVNIAFPLLRFGGDDPEAVKAVLAFFHRNDLTERTRTDLVHSLGAIDGLPEEVSRSLVKELDDPDPWVRAASLVAYADSTTAYHAMAKDRVEQMANDARENAQVRELARQAMAGQQHLNPNLDVPPESADKLNSPVD